jgi:hypothetical protein
MKKRILTFCLFFFLNSILYILVSKYLFSDDNIEIPIMISGSVTTGLFGAFSDKLFDKVIKKMIEKVLKPRQD